jgi:hypothetical protein
MQLIRQTERRTDRQTDRQTFTIYMPLAEQWTHAEYQIDR